MDPLIKNNIANTKKKVTRLGFGAGTLGDRFEITSDKQADETIDRAYQDGMNYFDTAPWYGNTKSEHRLGKYLRKQTRSSYLLNTKVGRIYHRPKNVSNFHNSPWMKSWKGGLPFDFRFDYTAEGIQRSYEDSLQRLGINTIDFLTIHDLDFKHQGNEENVRIRLNELEKHGGYKVLSDMKSTGEISAIGVGINHIGMIPLFLERFDIDFFLVSMPYTLLNQEALKTEFPLCEKHKSSVIIGAVYCSGVLAQGVDNNPKYGYQPADQEVIKKVNKINTICQSYHISLGAAAIQFPLGHKVVSSVIPGPNSPEQVILNRQWMETPIPSDFWEELKQEKLICQQAPNPPEQ